MVPSPLSFKSLSGRRYPLAISDAISSAASPLQSSFQLSCRSPLSPRAQTLDGDTPRNTARFSEGSSLAPPKFLALRADAPTSRLAKNEDTADPDVTDDASSYTAYSPTDHAWSLPPNTPSALQYEVRQDEGKLGVVSAINIIVGKTVGVGAYTIPSAIFDGVGSVGMTLLLWVVGSIISFCGLAVYLELGTAMPKSGGERVYLERIFRKPRMLATCMFMSYTVLLGFSTPNAIVLGDYVLYALDIPRNRWNVRVIAVLVVTAFCYIHARFPKTGLRVINGLGISKLLILVFVILCGAVGGMMGIGRVGDALSARRLDLPLTHDSSLSTAQRNFSNLWEGSSMQPYDYATALLKVIYCFRGYSTANQVLSDVKDPVRTLKIAAPVALGIVSFSYLTLNVAFFLVVDKEDFKSAGVVVAGTFFRNLFGEVVGRHILPLFVIISAAGNIAATSFAQARVNEELAKDGLLPLSGFWTTKSTAPPKTYSRSSSTPNVPSRGLLLHWVVSVVVIIVPPPGKVYNFLVDIGGYPVSIISVAISLGLLYLRHFPSERWSTPFHASRIAIVVFALSNCLLLIFPWVPPMNGQGEGAGITYYAYPATALAVLGSGSLYWCWWVSKGNGRVDVRQRERWAKSRQSRSEFHGLLSGHADAPPQDEGQASGNNPDIRRRAPCGCPISH
ncbi:putative Amino acid permease/ SLC12A domain-containing protein [Seiridium cardinale]